MYVCIADKVNWQAAQQPVAAYMLIFFWHTLLSFSEKITAERLLWLPAKDWERNGMNPTCPLSMPTMKKRDA
jgi:hypothetical protein